MAEEWRRKRIASVFHRDARGNPAGGFTDGPGVTIIWQNGIPAITGHEGAHVEDLIDAAIERLEFFQEGEYKCIENARALDALHEALLSLEARTKNRIDRGVEGTYAP